MYYVAQHALTLTYQTTRRHIPEDYGLDTRSCNELDLSSDWSFFFFGDFVSVIRGKDGLIQFIAQRIYLPFSYYSYDQY